jgi:gamma-glutamylcysteine synthetase
MAPYPVENEVIALSIRNSCFGYQNFDDLFPDYSSVKSFRNSIDQMIKEGKIAASKELYTPVRPKFLNGPDHISYLEFRCIDNDPLSRAGISTKALQFLHALALFGLLSDEADSFDAVRQAEANRYHTGVALYGLDTESKSGKKYMVWMKGKAIVAKMKELFENLEIINPVRFTTC